MTSQFAAMMTNPEYGQLFGLKLAKVRIRAIGLFCGLYDLSARGKMPRQGIYKDYIGKLPIEDPRFRCLESITEDYPPAFIVTAAEDFLRDQAEPMYNFLRAKGLEAQWKCYGQEGDRKVGHVFHVNILLPEAVECNDDAAAFFRRYV